MYRALFEAFGAQCVTRIWNGVALSARDREYLTIILDAREASGQRLLGTLAGPDPCIDTVTGRCGHSPTYAALRQ